MQILEAADHGEIAAEISATNVNRIALAGDRIAKVVRSPDGYAVEHDAASGDIYLRPAGAQPGTPAAEASGFEPVTLFIGTEKGFTYRLTLMPAARASAQILIRNADAVPAAASVPASGGEPRIGVRGEPHVAALVRLVRAVTRREPLPGYAIHAGGQFAGGRHPACRDLAGPALRGARAGSGHLSPPLRRAVRRASPGPSGACRASAPLPRSGWRRRRPAPRAGGSAWRWSRPPRQGTFDERPRRPAPCRRRERRRCGPAAPAAAVLGHRGGRAGRGCGLARHGRQQDRRAAGRHRCRDRGAGRRRDGLDAALGGAAQQGRECAAADGAGGAPAAHRERGAQDEAGGRHDERPADHRRPQGGDRRPRAAASAGRAGRRAGHRAGGRPLVPGPGGDAAGRRPGSSRPARCARA